MDQYNSMEVNIRQLEPKPEMAAVVQNAIIQRNDPPEIVAIVQNDVIQRNDPPEMVAVVQNDVMEINDPQPPREAEPPVFMELTETYEHLKVEIIDLFQMLKFTRSSSQLLERALQINPSLQLLRHFEQQVEEQINANLQQELEEFDQNMVWNEIAIHEIAIPWNID